MLTVKELFVSRGGKQVLHDVALNVMPGQITALVGANGAGKSTVVLSIAGALTINAGQIILNDKALQKSRPEWIRAAGVAVVPEGHRVLGDLTVLDNLKTAALGLTAAESLVAINRALDVFPELREKLSAHGRALSGGQKQMVCIAQALVIAPKYLIVDELSLGLAPTVVKRLVEVLEQQAAAGVGVLLIEQFTSLALAIATNAYVLERGKIVFSGTAAELHNNPSILHNSYLATPLDFV